MAATKQLAAVARSGSGKGAARSVRREGRVPGVIYGGGEKPEPISVDFKELNKLVYGGHFLTTIFELEVAGRKERVLARDYQLDVVSDRPLHVDFLRLRTGSRVRIRTPVHVVNQDLVAGRQEGRRGQSGAAFGRALGAGGRHPQIDHHRPRRSRFSQFGASFGRQAARGLQAGRDQGRPHGGDHRAADRLQGRDPRRAGRDFGRAGRRRAGRRGRRRPGRPAKAAAAAPAKGAAAAPAKGAAAAPAKAPPAKK